MSACTSCKVQPRQDTFVTPASPQKPKGLEKNEPVAEIRSDSDQDDSLTVSNKTVRFSDTSLKLSSSTPVKSSDKSTSIDNNVQARQSVSQLIVDFKNNPPQAHDAQSNVFAGAVKSLLG